MSSLQTRSAKCEICKRRPQEASAGILDGLDGQEQRPASCFPQRLGCEVDHVDLAGAGLDRALDLSTEMLDQIREEGIVRSG